MVISSLKLLGFGPNIILLLREIRVLVAYSLALCGFQLVRCDRNFRDFQLEILFFCLVIFITSLSSVLLSFLKVTGDLKRTFKTYISGLILILGGINVNLFTILILLSGDTSTKISSDRAIYLIIQGFYQNQ